MTPEEIHIAKQLGKLTIPANALFDLSFIHTVSSYAETNPRKDLSTKQREWLYRMLYKYRKQLSITYERYKSNPWCKPLKKRQLN